ncbi:MAG: hypothetical protein IKB80_00220 [Oscillospiraceae bacterium]|nr:hypothetical protein [Oscillospiraceae bacterium]
MKMNDYLTALQTQLTTQQLPNQNLLDLLYDAYNDTTGMDNEEIKADFERLYEIMNGKPLKEIDEIIYAVCTLCRDHEKAGFVEGVKVGIGLGQELAK